MPSKTNLSLSKSILNIKQFSIQLQFTWLFKYFWLEIYILPKLFAAARFYLVFFIVFQMFYLHEEDAIKFKSRYHKVKR